MLTEEQQRKQQEQEQQAPPAGGVDYAKVFERAVVTVLQGTDTALARAQTEKTELEISTLKAKKEGLTLRKALEVGGTAAGVVATVAACVAAATVVHDAIAGTGRFTKSIAPAPAL